jgi:hypothetical protein
MDAPATAGTRTYATKKKRQPHTTQNKHTHTPASSRTPPAARIFFFFFFFLFFLFFFYFLDTQNTRHGSFVAVIETTGFPTIRSNTLRAATPAGDTAAAGI